MGQSRTLLLGIERKMGKPLNTLTKEQVKQWVFENITDDGQLQLLWQRIDDAPDKIFGHGATLAQQNIQNYKQIAIQLEFLLKTPLKNMTREQALQKTLLIAHSATQYAQFAEILNGLPDEVFLSEYANTFREFQARERLAWEQKQENEDLQFNFEGYGGTSYPVNIAEWSLNKVRRALMAIKLIEEGTGYPPRS